MGLMHFSVLENKTRIIGNYGLFTFAPPIITSCTCASRICYAEIKAYLKLVRKKW